MKEISKHILLFLIILLIIPWKFLPFLILGFITLYQKEIRILLNKIQIRILFKKKFTSEQIDLKPLLEKLSKSLTGAIIVIKQNDKIPNLFKGIKLDSHYSTQLMESIFNPSSPTHDGAVILHNGKIESIKVILPLSNKESLSRYGTRHRAGLKTSELCDCKIIIVSEESGKVSFFHKGKMIPEISLDNLDELLGI